MRVAVAGGTGQVGSRVAAHLRERGDDVVVLSRTSGVDLVAGNGLASALSDVEAIVDCTSTGAQKAAECVAFFSGVARNLQDAGAAAGVTRIVTLSIVGLEPMAGRGHYAGKLAQEAATKAGAVPWSILRATQFHTFAGSLIEWIGKGPLLPCPVQPVQPVDLELVATHLVRLAVSPDGAGERTTTHLAGPQRIALTTAMRRTAKARGRRGVVVALWLPGAAERAARSGAALAPEGAIIEGRSFDAWIEAGAPA